MIITIDGPAGSGKSTLARKLSHALGFVYLESGSLYRALTWAWLQKKKTLATKRKKMSYLQRLPLKVMWDHPTLKIFLRGREIPSPALFDPRVTGHVRDIASLPPVREKVNRLCRRFSRGRNVVAEGRDEGTVVFPHADLKFFFTASLEVRARRRLQELQAKGYSTSLQRVWREIQERDRQDKNRKMAPLRKPEQAISVHTSERTPRQVLNQLLFYVRRYRRGE